MVVIPHISELDTNHVSHLIAIGAHEVTADQYRRFQEDSAARKNYLGLKSAPWNGPLAGVSFYEAMAYCNWPSAEESIPRDQWCYLPLPSGTYAEGMTIKPDFLQLSGYRLPIETECLQACRAMSHTTYSFGEPIELLSNYSFFGGRDSRLLPVGWLRPNDYGMFDMHGGVFEWCHAESDGVLLGGGFSNPAMSLRVHQRVKGPANQKGFDRDFRLARTYNLSP
jgi:formylglycine-generating enzyme required for sulfatase activity